MAINMADKAMNEVLKDVKIGTPLEKKWTDTRDKIKESAPKQRSLGRRAGLLPKKTHSASAVAVKAIRNRSVTVPTTPAAFRAE